MTAYPIAGKPSYAKQITNLMINEKTYKLLFMSKKVIQLVYEVRYKLPIIQSVRGSTYGSTCHG